MRSKVKVNSRIRNSVRKSFHHQLIQFVRNNIFIVAVVLLMPMVLLGYKYRLSNRSRASIGEDVKKVSGYLNIKNGSECIELVHVLVDYKYNNEQRARTVVADLKQTGSFTLPTFETRSIESPSIYLRYRFKNGVETNNNNYPYPELVSFNFRTNNQNGRYYQTNGENDVWDIKLEADVDCSRIPSEPNQ